MREKNNNNQDKNSSTEDKTKKKKRYRSLNVLGTKYRTLYNKKFENRKQWQKTNDKLILSFIPGTIKKIFVEEGQKVLKGDDMMIFEAMKMNNIIKFPHSGTIKSVHVKEEDRVPKGFIMMEYDEIYDM